MMKLVVLFVLSTTVLLSWAEEKNTPTDETQNKEDEKPVEADPEKLSYAKGSVCSYCQYCLFCTLCDKDCPCETSPSKPNCDMCKYCKYCPICRVCDSVCKPGGFIDSLSATIVNSLPSFNKEEVDGDIKRMEDWIKIKRDEL